MKLKNTPIGSTIIYNGAMAQVLGHGSMGTRVNVFKGNPDAVTFGKQIWSSESLVEYAPGFENSTKMEVST